jgi:hypothetical protein
MVESLGGRLDAFYFVFGENDVHVILDLPENLTAAAISLAVSQQGGQHEDDRASHTRRDRSGGEKAGRLRAATDSSWGLVHQVSDWGSGVAIKMGRRQGATKEHI